MNGIASAVLYGIVASVPKPAAISAKAMDPSGARADTTPLPPELHVTRADRIRATIVGDAKLRERWHRGSALLGAGIVTTVGAGGMLVLAGIMAATDGTGCGTSTWTVDGVTTTTRNDPCPKGGITNASI